MLGRVAFLCVVASAAACLISTSGLDDGASTTDAGATLDATADATTTITTADAANVVDAAPEATTVDASDGAALGFCAANAALAGLLYCDDFDQPGRTDIRSEGWQAVNPWSTGVPSTDQFFSSPQSAKLVWDQTSDASVGVARAIATRTMAVPAGTTSVSLSFRIYPELDVPSSLDYVKVQLGNCYALLSDSIGSGNCLNEGSTTISTPGLKFGNWNFEKVTVTTSQTGVTFAVTVGEGSAATTTQTPLVLDGGANTAGGLYVELGWDGNNESATIFYDDILAEAH